MIRLQKFLSQAGVASRRASEALILEGRVRVNGRVMSELGVKVDPETDRVEVDGRRVEVATPAWIALHKPRGYVTTRKDPEERKTVYDLLPKAYHSLFYVGRLDVESEGLVVLTNDGDAAHRLQHPRFEVDRVYHVEVQGKLGDEARRKLLRGVKLEDGYARAQEVRSVASPTPDRDRLIVTLREGRNREVRRLLEAVGHPVTKLRRVRFGPIELGTLKRGEHRMLTEDEIARLAGPA